MRFRELQKIKNEKFLNKKYSDFELEELVQEIKEYKVILKSIGFDETAEEKFKVKRRSKKKSSKKAKSKNKKKEQ